MNNYKPSQTGLSLWEKAKSVIPGGNGLLSKRPDRYCPDIWPSYFEKSKGVNVWDLDGQKYIDMAQMGMGTAILGYSHTRVNDAVINGIYKGVGTTLNTPEEVELAERLLELNPFAGGVRFARTGGEALAIAVRIARAASGRGKIAFSGYHGWSDWYLAANLRNKDNLEGHLLPGLSPYGVPGELADTAIPFQYNNVSQLNDVLAAHHDIGVIVVEGARFNFPTRNFLEAITKASISRDIVIVSDEITSGWRVTDGGVYKINGFEPDIVVYGKALGNGFAISAVVGKEEIMSCAQDTFISSSFWTERVGFVAALETINILTTERVWDHLVDIGSMIGEGWLKLAEKHQLDLSISEFKPLITMKLHYDHLNSPLITLFTQEMLKRGYLATGSVFVSYAHNREIVEEYLQCVDQVFGVLAQALTSEKIADYLDTRVKSDSFARLT